MAYTWKCASGALSGLSRAEVTALWRRFLSSPVEMGAWHLAFLALVAYFSARGLHRGIELATKIRGPALLGLLLVLDAYALATGDVRRGLAFAFAPNFCAITPEVVLVAIGQAFYATGVGMAMMLAYGAYVSRGTSLVRSAAIICGAILLVSLLSTLLVFPLVFQYGMNPAQGTELVFDVLPKAFAEMPAGRLVGTLFFLLLVFAALTPSIASLEPTVAHVLQRTRLRRGPAVLALGRRRMAPGDRVGLLLQPLGTLEAPGLPAGLPAKHMVRHRGLRLLEPPPATRGRAHEHPGRLAPGPRRGGGRAGRDDAARPAGLRLPPAHVCPVAIIAVLVVKLFG